MIIVRMYIYFRKYPVAFRKMTPLSDIFQMFIFLRNVSLKEQSVVRNVP